MPPDFPGMQPPLLNFGLFDPERARGKNARLPVAVTSTLHAPSDLPLASDDVVLQALLGDATSYAASGTNQLPVNDDQRQQVQSALAHQRIQQLAASAQERLRVQGPSFPQSAAQYFGRQSQSYPTAEATQHDRQNLQRLAGLLQPSVPSVNTIEHYEPLGSGRPTRTSAQQSHSYQQPPSNNWIHRQVLPRQHDARPGLTRLTPAPHSPSPTMHARRQPEPNLDLHSMFPWDPNRWGGLPVDFEQNLKLRQQQQQQQQHTQSSTTAAHENSMLDPNLLGGYASLHNEREHAPRNSIFGQGLDTAGGYRPQSSDPAAAYRGQSPDAATGYRAQPSLFDAPHHYFQASSGPTAAENFGFPEPFAAADSSNDALQAYSQRLRQDMQSQGPPQQQPRQNTFPAWANQVCCCLPLVL